MIPQEKAQELFDKYYQLAESIEWTDKETMQKAENFNDELGIDVLIYWNELAKQSALIAVDEILNLDLHDVGDYKCFDDPCEWYISYWEEVKQEIEQL